MKIQYPARITYIEDERSFLVEFPDLKGCLTEGSTHEEALANAEEALSGYLSSITDRGIAIPAPLKQMGSDLRLIDYER